ncbi:MAG: primosomal protein N' [Treponemataceae bacterium]|nr:primosomal protein N' [Treponemataceae bacterium]
MSMVYVQAIVDTPVNGIFTYSADPAVFSDKTPLQPFVRAEVFFGKRKTTACITKIIDKLPPETEAIKDKIRPIIKIIDKEPVFDTELEKLALWISKYYLCSEGEALFSMLPSGRRETDSSSLTFEGDEKSFEKHTLSEEQISAVKGILNSTKGNLHYLFGQTGSGKTEVFLGAAEEVLSQGKGVIYLVPEIGLTHQVIEAVTERFGKTAAVLHSGLTGSQRLREWRRIMNREARVVIGARSAVFAPVPDLGLIIIDEEHDGSYKSGNTPRYHGRQVAIKRAQDLHIPLVMGSATPSAEAWQLMSEKRIEKHTLTRRLAGGKPPEIRIVDLSSPKNSKMNGTLSEELSQEIRATKNQGRQTILFLNRRGFTHFFHCNSCGFVLKCKNCSVSMTYHKKHNRLMCHYCGWSVEVPDACPECGSVDTGYNDFGTEYIESEIRTKFPDCSVDRVDTDSLGKKGDLQKKLADFREGKTDILLGTQMVAKGLNFPNLKLVGIVLADTGLNMPDFRAAERTFSLIVQVSGRAGRFFPDGKVIVQTYSPERPAISLACTTDTDGFYKQELETRQIMGFPPFSRLIRLVFRAAEEERAENSASSAAEILAKLAEQVPEPVEILGPSPCPLSMIAANHRKQVLLRAKNLKPLQWIVSTFLNQYKTPSGVYAEVDVDPINLL